jgi:hypothetical protein
MENTFIDIFAAPSTGQTQYYTHTWRGGHLTERIAHESLQSAVAYCKHLQLPVVANDSRLIFKLYRYGINAQPPQSVAIGQ